MCLIDWQGHGRWRHFSALPYPFFQPTVRITRHHITGPIVAGRNAEQALLIFVKGA